jgi:hypothetical protein
VINMLRQIGLAIGVAVLIAILGAPTSRASILHGYERASWAIAVMAVAGAVIGLALLSRRLPRADALSAVPATPVATEGATAT